MRAAVPQPIGSSFEDAPPGHRFRLYFDGWKDDWTLEKDKKFHAVQHACKLPESAHDQLEGLLARQDEFARSLPADRICTIPRFAAAPFVTGVGIEHPLENGFAFLDPYGLPYLPGSSVKGVVRRAAEELALFESDPQGWSVLAVWWLFGFDAASAFFQNPDDGDVAEPVRLERLRWREAFSRLTSEGNELLESFFALVRPQLPDNGPTTPGSFLQQLPSQPELRRAIHTRGSLDFWDVIPDVKTEEAEGSLRVDIMNPHYGHYYQNGEPPGDWGNPNPIFFLTLPVGTAFAFHVRLMPVRALPGWFTQASDGNEKPRWQHLLDAAFAHAFDWLGFGAKTAVGYGRMSPKQVEMREVAVQLPQAPKAKAEGKTRDKERVRKGALHAQHESPAPSLQRGSQQEAASPAHPLASVAERIRAFPNGRPAKEELEALLNLLARNRKDPAARELAVALWKQVKGSAYLANKMRKHPVVWGLIEPEGG